MHSIIKILIAAGLGLLCACAATPVQKWRSEPLTQTIAAPGLRVVLEPLKENEEFFVGFRLTLRNDGATPLTLDWNQTRYLHNGRDLGVFIYRGIDPATIQGHIPQEVVPAGATFTQEIFPLRTIAFLPSSEIPKQGRRGFIPGILPSGENGILLVLGRDGQESRQKLSVRLRAETESKQ
ncbi:MAG: hypothetical protein HY911_02790 [Desulfobacterales bacterium]|nr:hypothetical protein [Desulfobacterales bacterium]